VNALERMMFDMIALEGYAAGEDLWKVGQDAGKAIGGPAFEKEVMRTLVDHDEQRVICKGSQQIGGAEHNPP